MSTELPLDALEMALWTRERAGHTTDGRLEGLIRHSDAGSQLGFKGSSQHPGRGGCCGSTTSTRTGFGAGGTGSDAVAGSAAGESERCAATVLAADR
jgi:hypothetical protein